MMFAITLFVIFLTLYVIAWPFIAGAMMEKRTVRENETLREANEKLRLTNSKLANEVADVVRTLEAEQRKRG